MKFSKEVLQELAWDEAPDGYEIVLCELSDTTRWSVCYDLVFKFDGKFYATGYSKGATECQEERPYEYEPAEIECPEVFPVIVKKTVYKTAGELKE